MADPRRWFPRHGRRVRRWNQAVGLRPLRRRGVRLRHHDRRSRRPHPCPSWPARPQRVPATGSLLAGAYGQLPMNDRLDRRTVLRTAAAASVLAVLDGCNGQSSARGSTTTTTAAAALAPVGGGVQSTVAVPDTTTATTSTTSAIVAPTTAATTS